MDPSPILSVAILADDPATLILNHEFSLFCFQRALGLMRSRRTCDHVWSPLVWFRRSEPPKARWRGTQRQPDLFLLSWWRTIRQRMNRHPRRPFSFFTVLATRGASAAMRAGADQDIETRGERPAPKPDVHNGFGMPGGDRQFILAKRHERRQRRRLTSFGTTKT